MGKLFKNYSDLEVIIMYRWIEHSEVVGYVIIIVGSEQYSMICRTSYPAVSLVQISYACAPRTFCKVYY